MNFPVIIHYISLILEVCFIDIILSGDNAVVIALACRKLPKDQVTLALRLGTGIAILMRVILTIISSYLLHITGLKILAGFSLIVIAIKLIVTKDEDQNLAINSSKNIITAIKIILIADLAMSIDNVIALSAVAQGNLYILILGLVLSIPLLMFGSIFITKLLHKFPQLIQVGGAFLGWLGGKLIVTDDFLEKWISIHVPYLSYLVPILVVVYVLIQSYFLQKKKNVLNL